jgi:hypothetical protein
MRGVCGVRYQNTEEKRKDRTKNMTILVHRQAT